MTTQRVPSPLPATSPTRHQLRDTRWDEEKGAFPASRSLPPPRRREHHQPPPPLQHVKRATQADDSSVAKKKKKGGGDTTGRAEIIVRVVNRAVSAKIRRPPYPTGNGMCQGVGNWHAHTTQSSSLPLTDSSVNARLTLSLAPIPTGRQSAIWRQQ